MPRWPRLRMAPGTSLFGSVSFLAPENQLLPGLGGVIGVEPGGAHHVGAKDHAHVVLGRLGEAVDFAGAGGDLAPERRNRLPARPLRLAVVDWPSPLLSAPIHSLRGHRNPWRMSLPMMWNQDSMISGAVLPAMAIINGDRPEPPGSARPPHCVICTRVHPHQLDQPFVVGSPGSLS